MKTKMCLETTDIKRLISVAQGKEEADLAVVGGDLVDVYTGEVLKGWEVATKGAWIAYIGNDARHTIGPRTEVIDATGKTLIPGLIDGHSHITWLFNLDEFLKHAMKGGTTAVVTETIEIAFTMGRQGIIDYLESFRNQPIKIFATLPSMMTISPAAAARALDNDTLGALLERDEVVGLGETYWAGVLKGNDRINDLFGKTLAAGKRIEGHAAGARGNRLVSYMAAGVSSCHEPITVEEALDRIRLGVYAMIREGDVRKELPVISKIKDEPIDFRRLVLVTDGVGPQRLLREGYMDHVVQRAIDLGFDPITAIQMATLNPAAHFGMDQVMGGIAPGKHADIVVIPDVKTIKAEYVISKGRITAHNGTSLVEPQKPRFSNTASPALQPGRKLTPADFIIKAEGRDNTARVRVIDLVTNLVTRETHVDMKPHNGEIRSDVERDILKVAMIIGGTEGLRLFVGLIKGFGLQTGAIATTSAWDVCGLVVVGVNEADMAAAANRVFALHGGTVLYADGHVQAELAQPIAGLMSEQPLETVVQILDGVQRKMSDLGCLLPDPLLTLCILTTPAIPFLRISEEGLVDIKEGKIVDLIVR